MSYVYRQVAVQSLSCVWLFMTPWTEVHQASLPFTISLSLLKLISIDSVMPSNRLIFCHPLLLLPSILPRIRVFSNELALSIRWPKYWSFSINEWIFRVDFLYDWLVWSPYSPRDCWESSPAPQFKGINPLSLHCWAVMDQDRSQLWRSFSPVKLMSGHGGMKETACSLQRNYCQAETGVTKLYLSTVLFQNFPIWFSTSLGTKWVKDQKKANGVKQIRFFIHGSRVKLPE